MVSELLDNSVCLGSSDPKIRDNTVCIRDNSL